MARNFCTLKTFFFLLELLATSFKLHNQECKMESSKRGVLIKLCNRNFPKPELRKWRRKFCVCGWVERLRAIFRHRISNQNLHYNSVSFSIFPRSSTEVHCFSIRSAFHWLRICCCFGIFVCYNKLVLGDERDFKAHHQPYCLVLSIFPDKRFFLFSLPLSASWRQSPKCKVELITN
jgi:hypothetical protein